MGLFDRRGERADPASSRLETVRAEGQMTVPEGHKVGIHRVALSPSIVSLEGGAWLARIGSSSDDMEAELDAILAGVRERMRGPRPRVVLSNASGSLSSLMAPGNPEVTSYDGVLVWTVDAASLAQGTGGAALVQRWLRCIYTVRSGSSPVAQWVFLREVASRSARAVAALVRGLGVDVRAPEKDTAVLAEVHRPDGIILSALLGAPQNTDDPADRSAHQANQAKDLAEQQQDVARKQRLQVEERDALGHKLAPGGGAEVSPIQRSPRLRRLVLAVVDDGNAARAALYEELVRREIPLQVIVDRQTGGTQLSSWPGGVEALPVYADEVSLLASARDHGLQLGTFAAAVMPPRALFAWAAGNSWAIALNAFRGQDQPVYVVLTAEEVEALARAQLPARSR